MRVIPLAGKALHLLRARLRRAGRPGDLLFPGRKDGRPTEIPTAFRNAVKKAELSDFRFHDLRHSCAMFLVEGRRLPARRR